MFFAENFTTQSWIKSKILLIKAVAVAGLAETLKHWCSRQ